MSTSKSYATNFKRYVKFLAIALLFLFGVAPVILSAIPMTSTNNRFSIYNTGYDGLSVVRNDLQAQQNGVVPKYSIHNIISNLNVLNRFNGSGVLVINGPAANFEPSETFSLLLYLLRGGSLVVADDYGTGNQLLEPIFQLFNNLDNICKSAQQYGIQIPCVDNILNGFSGGSSSSSTSGGIIPNQITPGGSYSAGGNLAGSFLLTLLKSVKGFGFNSTGVLMDATSNLNNPARPTIVDIDHSSMPGYSFTKGVNKVQMEFGTIISLKLKVNVTTTDPVTLKKTSEEKIVYMPLQKLSSSVISGVSGAGSFDLSFPFFPLYSSKNSWIETNMKSAADGTAQPNPGEWGNAKFAVALEIPLFPGMGKIIFLADSSIFINRYTSQTATNDNLQLFRNIISVATYNQKPTATNPQIPVLFDFGHTYQGLASPALYSTALMKLIAELSMFPLYAPFLPFLFYGYGKKLIPENRRLRPILLTKRRYEKGHSDFEKKLEDIKASGAYGEPIRQLSNRLVRNVQKDVRFEGTVARNPKELAKFLVDNFGANTVGSRRELQSQLGVVFKIAANPTRRMTLIAAKKYLSLMKKLIDLTEK